MNNTNENANALNPDEFTDKSLPQGLKVLTTLTYIGCAVFGLFTLFTPQITKFSLAMMEKAASSGSEMTEKQLSDLEKGRQAIELTQAHMIPIMLLSLVGIILCFAGAYMMRKLKKDGFWIYVAGQVLPLLGNFAILGTAQFVDYKSFGALIIPVIFISLYARQRKYLVN